METRPKRPGLKYLVATPQASTTMPGVSDGFTHVAPMMYTSNTSYPQYDPFVEPSFAGHDLNQLITNGWKPSQLIFTYQSYSASNYNGAEQMFQKMASACTTTKPFTLTSWGAQNKFQGPFGGMLGWPAQLDKAPCQPLLDIKNLKLILKAVGQPTNIQNNCSGGKGPGHSPSPSPSPNPGPSPPAGDLCKICTNAGLNCISYSGAFNGAVCVPKSESSSNYTTTSPSGASFYCSMQQPCGTGVASGCIPGVSAPNWNCGNCATAGTQACGSLICRASKYSNGKDSTYYENFPKNAVTSSGNTITIDGLAAISNVGPGDSVSACSLKWTQPSNTQSYGYLSTISSVTSGNGKLPIIYKITSTSGKVVHVLATDSCGACTYSPSGSNWRVIDVSCKAMIKLGAIDLSDPNSTLDGQPSCNPVWSKENNRTGYGLLPISKLEPVEIKACTLNNNKKITFG